MAQTKTQLIYFGDPMCSWCYGFSPEMSKTLDSLGSTIDFQIVMGGLRPYNTQTMKDLSDFLKDHWKHVEEASGQPFSYDILQDTTFVYDTEPSCRAVVTMKALKPTVAFDFFKKIQQSFYEKNRNTNLVETYMELAEEFGVDKNIFKEKFESEEMKIAVRKEFEYSTEIGVRGFPTVVLEKDEKLYLLSNGYTTADKIIEHLNRVLSKKE